MTQRRSCVLTVTSDTALASQIRTDLQGAGYEAILAVEPSQAWQDINRQLPALVVIDLAHLTEQGQLFCHELRQRGDRLPILLLTMGNSLRDRIICLETGADDYIPLPYRSERFLTQVSFYCQLPQSQGEHLQFGDLSLDLNTRRALRGQRSFDLTMKEFELLKYLMQHPLEVVTREQILENVWGYDFMGESNVIEVYIRYLRLKLEEDGSKRLIQTVRGVGYVLRDA